MDVVCAQHDKRHSQQTLNMNLAPLTRTLPYAQPQYDALKYTLQKMHNTLYELSLVEASGGLKRRRDEGPDEEAAARQDTAPTDA